ncbi:MAG TPA: Gfo/Idh/MocA family oxidoreductase [Trueperaceae bacterium]
MSVVRWGVLGAAAIARRAVIPGLQRSSYNEVVALASRDRRRAREVASLLGIARSYGSYEELLADSEVDAIYNPLPNHLHVPWTLRALEAGKHVLCEKPIALDGDEAVRLLEASRRFPALKVMEAFMYRFHPQWQRTVELVRGGEVGRLRTVQSTFTYHKTDPTDIRNRRDAGGGGMLDIGCYCVSLSRLLWGSEPLRVLGIVEFDPDLLVDRSAWALLEFAGGTATFTCATQLQPYQRVQVLGDGGRLEVVRPFNAPADAELPLILEQGSRSEEILIPAADQYQLQGDAFARAVLEDLPVPTPLADAVANMRVIDAVFESARRQEWVELD